MTKISEELQINTYADSSQSFPAIASLINGGFIVAWQSQGQDGSGSGIYGQIFDNNGNPINNEFQVNTYTNSDQRSPSVTGLSNGGFVIAWSSANQVDEEKKIGGIYGQRFDFLGNPIGNEFLIYASSYWNPFSPMIEQNFRYIGSALIDKLSNANLISVINEFTVHVIGSAGGHHNDIYGQLFDNNGNSIGEKFTIRDISKYGNAKSLVALNNDILVIAWNGLMNRYISSSVYLDIFNGSTSIFNNDLQIDTLMDESTYNEYNPSITSLDQGNFLVTWQAHEVAPYSADYSSVYPNDRLLNGDIYGQFFSANGTPIGEQIQITNNPDLDQVSPSTTRLNDNEIVVVWKSEDQEGSKDGIYGQVLDKNGNLIAREFQIDSSTNFEKSSPSVITLANGNLMAVWESQGQDGSGSGIYGQIFSSEIDEILDTPIYRFQNIQQSGYLFVGEEERQNILNNFPQFQEEGFAFSVGIEANDDLIPIYRFQNQDVPGAYLYTNEEERQSILNNYPNFIEEGLAFYVYGADANQGADVYRFQNSLVPGTYIFVGEGERQNILNNYPNFIEEGIAFGVAV